MKYLFLILVLSVNFSYAAEVGEDQKSDCIFANQSAKREAKEVSPSEEPATKEKTSSTKSV